MEPAAFQVSYWWADSALYIKRSEKLSKEQRVTTNLVDLSKPALRNFLSIPPLTDISVSPSSQPKASWNSRLLLPFGVFCLQVLPFPWEGPGVGLGRKGIPWPLLLLQVKSKPCSPPLWLLTKTKENTVTGANRQQPPLPAFLI